MSAPTKFRVRQALKDYLRYAASGEHSVSDLVRLSLNELLEWSKPLSPQQARALVAEERGALDGNMTHPFTGGGPDDVCPFSSYRYRDTPWVSLTVQLEPALIDGLRREAKRLGVKRDELLRGAVFASLSLRYSYPPNQYPSEAEVGYTHGAGPNGEPLDPRHPRHRGSEQEAIRRLRRLAAEPDAPEYVDRVQNKFNDYIRKLRQDYYRFITKEG